MSHFSDIGFNIETPEQLDQMLTTALNEGDLLYVSGGAYIHWQAGEGIEMWIQTDEDDQVVGMNPHFSGAGRWTVGIEDTVYNPAIPLDGAVIGWGTPPEEGQVEKGTFQFMADMPNFRLVEERIIPQLRCTVQVAAFAHRIAAYTNLDDFKVNSYESGAFAPKSFVPTGLIENDRIAAEAFLSGIVKSARILYNPLSGLPFYHILIDTLGGTVDVVADSVLLPALPVEGGIIQGEFWLSATLLSTTHTNGNGHV